MSPNDNCKKLLWEDLKDVSNNLKGSWMVAGDFNDIAVVQDKKGGLPASNIRFQKMRDKMDVCKLNNIEAHGPKFT